MCCILVVGAVFFVFTRSMEKTVAVVLCSMETVGVVLCVCVCTVELVHLAAISFSLLSLYLSGVFFCQDVFGLFFPPAFCRKMLIDDGRIQCQILLPSE